MLPAIYFLFSRAACRDSVTYCLRERLRLNTPAESKAIERYLAEKIQYLDRSDLDCLDYDSFHSALCMGVAAHHAGALPLFKEAVEELFTSGLIKVVFATETLSLGINMPARSVIIESLSKWNGEEHRPLLPGEYKQLTGRAGRRGIDDEGFSVVLFQRFFNVDAIRSLVNKEPHPVVSRFEVSYNMAANMLAEHDLAETQRLLNLSFAQYSADKRVVTLQARLETLDEDLERELTASRCPEADATRFRALEKQIAQMQRRLATITKDRRAREIRDSMAAMKPGDVFTIGQRGSQKIFAVVRKHQGKKDAAGILVVDPTGRYRRLTLETLKQAPRVVGAVEVSKITSPTKKVRRQVGVTMETLGRKAEPAQGPERSPEETELAEATAKLISEMKDNACNECAHSGRCMEAARKVEKISRQIESASTERDSGYDVVSRRLVDVVDLLNAYGFMEGATPTHKGDVLRRVYNECDLLLVEAIDAGVMSRLEPAELAAFASWFIYESRETLTDEDRAIARAAEAHMQGELAHALEWLNTTLAEMKEAEGARGLDLLGFPDAGFGEAAFMWAQGAGLDEMLSRFPDRSIGDMVRTMKQIIDLLRQLAEVAEDPVLAGNLRRAMDDIDRGVVGYSSLESIIEHASPAL
jgi:ATP-dependent RNA helicase HelY